MPLPPAVALAWDPSTDPSVTGYKVYYGTASRTYTNMIAAGSATSVIVSNLVSGVTYYFAATTYTADGMESDYSAEAAYSLLPPNIPPTLDVLTNLTISQDAGTQVVQLTGISSGSSNEIQTLSVSAFSSNPALISDPVVNYTSPDTNGTLSFAPITGSFGSAIITVMVDDGGAISNTIIRSFTVTVVPPLNPPTIDLLSDVTINENSGQQTVSLTGIASGSTSSNTVLKLSALSSNPALIPTPGINYTSPASTGSLTFAPVTNAFGSAVITVTVTDDQPTNNTSSVSFHVTVNQVAPFIPGLLTNAIIAPNTTFKFIVNPPTNNGDKFNFSLGAGAPAGAKLISRRGLTWLVWTPTLAQASTTNLIAISITDSRNPLLNTNEDVQVIVQDYLALAVGSTSLQSGQNGSVPLTLSSSDGITNVSFAIGWPGGSLPSPSLTISAPGVASSSLSPQGTNVLINIQMAANQVLQGSNIIGSISFQSLASQPSGYLNLPISNVNAMKPSATAYLNVFPAAGQVAVVNNQAMLQAGANATQSRTLTVLGKVGATYQVQYCTNFGPSSVWYSGLTYSQTNVSQNISLDPSLGQVWYRVQQK